MKRWIPRLAPLLTLALTTAAWACPMCKDSVANSDAQQPGGVPGGFNTTIYFMLGAFFCVLGMISTTLVKGARSSAGPRSGGRGFPLR